MFCTMPLRRDVFATATLLAIACTALPACTPFPALADPKVNFPLRDFHLASGMHVVVEEDHTAPVVGVVCTVGAGAVADPPGKEGLAHLVEHLTFRAQPTPGRSVFSLLEQAGAGMFNAITGADAVTYLAFGPRDTLYDLLTIEGLRMTDPLAGVDEEMFAVERRVVVNESHQSDEESYVPVRQASLRALFPSGHPYARLSNRVTLDGLTLKDARAFAARHYRPENMTLVIAGDVDLTTIDRLLAASLGPTLFRPPVGHEAPKTRRSTLVLQPPSPPPDLGPITVTGPVSSPEVRVLWSLPSTYGPEGYQAVIASFVVQSSAAEARRDTKNAITGVRVNVNPGAEASILVCALTLRSGGDPKRAAAAVFKNLPGTWRNIFGGRGGERLLGNIQVALRGELLKGAEEIVLRAGQRANFAHLAGDPALYAAAMRSLEAIDWEKTRSYFDENLDRQRARMVVVLPDPAAATQPKSVAEIETSSLPTIATPAAATDLNVAYDVNAIGKVARPVDFKKHFVGIKLGNGLVVEAAKHGITPMATIALRFSGGRSEETAPGAARIAAMLTHTAGEDRFARIGAAMTQRLTDDSLTISVTVDASNLGPALDTLASHVMNLNVPADQLPSPDDWRSAARELQRNPESRAWIAFKEALFRGHPYQVGRIREDQPPPDAAAVNRWLATVATPNRAVLAVVGRVDPVEVTALARLAFKEWHPGPVPAPSAAMPASGVGATVVTDRPGMTQAHVYIGCRLPPATEGVSVAYDALAATVDHRLWQSIRVERGLSYGFTAASLVYREGTAVLLIVGAVEKQGLAPALGIIHRTLAGARSMASADFDFGRWTLARSYNLNLVSPSNWVGAALYAGLYGWDIGTVDSQPAVLASIDREPLIAALERCATEGVISIVGDAAAAKAALDAEWR